MQSLVPLSPHRPSPGNCLREHRESRRLPHHASQRPAITPVEVDLRASAVLSSSECLFSGGDDALATHFLALTHHAWPNHDFGATTSSHDQILNQTLNDQILNDSAAAATPQKPELGSSKDTAKPRVAAVATVAAAPKPHRPWLMFHRLPAVLNRLASMLRAVSAVVNRRASDYAGGHTVRNSRLLLLYEPEGCCRGCIVYSDV